MIRKRIGIIGGAVGLAAVGYGLYRYLKARNFKRSLVNREAHVEM